MKFSYQLVSDLCLDNRNVHLNALGAHARTTHDAFAMYVLSIGPCAHLISGPSLLSDHFLPLLRLATSMYRLVVIYRILTGITWLTACL